MRLARTLARGAAFAVVAYSGYAVFNYLRYGRARKAQRRDLLDAFMPDPEVIERQSIGVNAPTDITYEECRKVDVTDSRLAQFLFDARALMLGTRPVHADLPKTFVEQMKAIGWTVLEEAPGHEIVLGAAAKPWKSDAGFKRIPASEFARFDDPGWVKIVFNISVEPVARCCSLVITETRAAATDRKARRLFRRYWALVSPGVRLIRKSGLRSIKAAAEARMKKTLKSAASAA